MDVRIEPSWKKALAPEWEKPYFIHLARSVRQAYSTTTVYPAASKIFAAFDCCPFENVKVVILGQDPYHGPGQANGLSFSVSQGIDLPRSLRNIFREISTDLSINPPLDGDLSRWARQGVLLLNSTLTVEAHRPGSHGSLGWERLTDAAISTLSQQKEGIVFLLWGAWAQRKISLIDTSRHCIIASAHPSPLSASRGFFGSRPFSRTNTYLIAHGSTPIDWR